MLSFLTIDKVLTKNENYFVVSFRSLKYYELRYKCLQKINKVYGNGLSYLWYGFDICRMPTCIYLIFDTPNTISFYFSHLSVELHFLMVCLQWDILVSFYLCDLLLNRIETGKKCILEMSSSINIIEKCCAQGEKISLYLNSLEMQFNRTLVIYLIRLCSFHLMLFLTRSKIMLKFIH